MFLAFLGLIPALAPLFFSYLTRKADAGTESEKIQANLIIAQLQAKLQGNASDNRFLSLRLPKAFFFWSVSFYISIIFIASGLGVDTNQFSVKHIPSELNYIPYALVGYWTLNIFKGQ